MSFINSIFQMPALVGVTLAFVGCIMLLFPPKKINQLYGYRTSRSMENQVQWDFSQKYSAKLLIICGLTLTIISFTGLLIKLPSITEGILSAVLIIGAIVVVLVKTEKAIKSKFDS